MESHILPTTPLNKQGRFSFQISLGFTAQCTLLRRKESLTITLSDVPSLSVRCRRDLTTCDALCRGTGSKGFQYAIAGLKSIPITSLS
ncbi:hypothetical protein CDAR_611431 [Caerostris darwini]|uniref:Uncharacterized protein n=1 Tax=Caerostris darwini TaxID=1538125 RepID=A0AAV4UQD3_9ARAC|nr:hypothetical protein CDAR_611431 [Caerostris darwini]